MHYQLILIVNHFLIAGTDNQIDTVGAGQSVTVSLPSNVEIATSVAVPTVKTAAIQHSAGNNAATIDSLGDITGRPETSQLLVICLLMDLLLR